MSDRPLQRVGEIELAGGTYDVAKNGEHYHVVEISIDDYGRPSAVKLSLFEASALFSADGWAALAEALLDALGEKMVSLEGRRAMQHPREIEP